jgi:hypothetical protein
MNRLGMMVDIAHVSDKTFWDALATSKAPIFSSHSSCRAISDVPRNMTDEMIKALGAEGRRDSDQFLVRLFEEGRRGRGCAARHAGGRGESISITRCRSRA